MFRDLRADEIECRVAQAKENGVSLLLYKDARCDQTILDETVGAMNWQRHHSRDNANCTVSIWDADKKLWIGKEDTGTESNTEKEKGLASDSFKRACFNWGIGRELYTAPFIWIKPGDCTALKSNGQKWQCFDTFEVEEIVIENKRIVAISIINTKSGKRCFTWEAKKSAVPMPKKQTPAEYVCTACGRVVEPYKNSKGVVTVQRHCAASMSQFGKIICVNCINEQKRKEVNENA